VHVAAARRFYGARRGGATVLDHHESADVALRHPPQRLEHGGRGPDGVHLLTLPGQ
jgi:hypothetical protein